MGDSDSACVAGRRSPAEPQQRFPRFAPGRVRGTRGPEAKARLC